MRRMACWMMYVAGLTVLLACGLLSTQSSHPRLWVTGQEVPRLRALSTEKGQSPLGFVPAEAFAAIRKQADTYLKEKEFTYTVTIPGLAGNPPKEWRYTLSDEAPPRHGGGYSHYAVWTGMSHAIEQRITTLSFVALVTQEPAYFEKAREMVLHLCKWPCVDRPRLWKPRCVPGYFPFLQRSRPVLRLVL